MNSQNLEQNSKTRDLQTKLEIKNLDDFSVEFTPNLENAIAWNKYFLQNNLNNSKTKLIILSLFTTLFVFLFSIISIRFLINLDYFYDNFINISQFDKLIQLFILTGFTSFLTIFYYFFFYNLETKKAKKTAKNTANFLQKTKYNFAQNIELKSEKVQTFLEYSVFVDFLEDKDYLFLRLN